MSVERHWTTRSPEDLRYSIVADVILQIDRAMTARGLMQKDIAERMGVNESRVSQLLTEARNQNLTLDVLIRLGAAVGLKPAIVMYEDVKESGAPVFAEVFTHCWSELGCPPDFWRWHQDDKPCGLCNGKSRS